MPQTFEVTTDEAQWPDKTVVRKLIDILNHADGDHYELVIEGLRSLDSCGLEMLVLMSDMAAAKGVTLILRRPWDQVKKMLGLTGIDRLIPIEA